MTAVITDYHSPLGLLTLAAADGELLMCDWNASPLHHRHLNALTRSLGVTPSPGTSAITLAAIAQLDEYFAGERREFSIPLRLIATPFQQRVWQSLADIPHGATESYLSLAIRLGNPLGVRAVARAVGANPLSIIIPCHRVIGSDGSMTGYAGGLPAKRALLSLERSRKGSL